MIRLLLGLYPKAWRNEYGAEMQAVFAARRRSTQGLFSLILLWLETIADHLPASAAVHLDFLRQDLRYCLRGLRRARAFAVTAILIAAAGIGATTAAFTLVDHVLIRPLPFPQQDRLVKVFQSQRNLSGRFEFSPLDFRDWKRTSTSFESFGAYRGLSVNLTGNGDPLTLDGASVTSEVFPILGVQPILGRWFSAKEDTDASAATVILSYATWQNVFSGDPGILGRVIDLYDTPYTVIGVMPRNFYFPSRTAQLWTSMRWGPRDFGDRGDFYCLGIARLKPGVTPAAARTELRTITAQLVQSLPREFAQMSADVLALRDEISPQSLLMLRVLLGASFCVLLVACMNLANLLIARSLQRRRELAVRAALGAGRDRLIRQTLTESLLLAAAGGALGLLLARAALPMLVRLVPVSLPIPETPRLDPTVLLFCVALTFLTGIAFGVMPALRATRGDRAADLRESGRSAAGGRSERTRSILVIAEIAGSIVLLAGFGLFVRALWRVQSIDPGFRAEHVITLRTALPVPRYQTTAAREPFYARVLDATRRLPGVVSAGYTSFLPMASFGGIWPVEVEGQPEDPATRRSVSLRFVTPDYFRTMSIPLLAGRDVAEGDTESSPYVVLVSQSFVRRYWPNQNPIGHIIDLGNSKRRIIGIVGDVKFRGLERQHEPQVYASWKQPRFVSPWYAPKDLVVRTERDPMTLTPALTRIIHEADPKQPIADVQPLTDVLDTQTSSRRTQLWVLGAFGATGFLLAAVGIHSLLSFAVSARTAEIGVRMALGANRLNIVRMTMRDAIRLGVFGTVTGIALAWIFGRALESLLAGIDPHDAPAFAAAAIVALLMTLGGSFMPALRASRVDPATAIRAD